MQDEGITAEAARPRPSSRRNAHHRSSSPAGVSRFRWFLAILGAATVVAVVAGFGDLRHFLAMLRQAHPLWMLAAVVFQLGTYLAVALGWWLILRRAGSPQSLERLLPIGFMKLFADQVLPTAGMGGNVLLVDRLTALGAGRGAAVAALLVSMVGYYAIYAALALVMLLLLWVHDKATPLLAGLVTAFLLVALAIPSLALWLRHRGSRPLPKRVERLKPVSDLLHAVGEAPAELVADRRLILTVALLNGLVFLCDAATLELCLFSIGERASFATAFISLIAASIGATLIPAPFGLGSFEASSTAMLGLLGVPIAAGLAATLLLRGLILWLPLIPGLWLTRRAMMRPTVC